MDLDPVFRSCAPGGSGGCQKLAKINNQVQTSGQTRDRNNISKSNKVQRARLCVHCASTLSNDDRRYPSSSPSLLEPISWCVH